MLPPLLSPRLNPDGCSVKPEQEPDALASARFGAHEVTSDDLVFADDDGVLFVAADRADGVLDAARAIWRTERDQAEKIRAGETLRRQTTFDDYLARRAADPSYSFRRHLGRIGGAIEE
jgi:4-hydroxy-4-methyl-2-oxoglutarate aldolase